MKMIKLYNIIAETSWGIEREFNGIYYDKRGDARKYHEFGVYYPIRCSGMQHGTEKTRIGVYK